HCPLGGSALPADDRPPATRPTRPSQGQKQPPHGGWPPPSGGWPPPRQDGRGVRRGQSPGPGGRPPSPQLQQRALGGLLFGLLSMFALFAFSDLIGQLGDLHRTELLVGFSLAVGAVSLWLGVTAVTESRRAATARPRGAASAIVLGGIGVIFSLLLL